MKNHRFAFINAAVCIGLIVLTLLAGFGVQKWIEHRKETAKFRIDADRIISLTFYSGYNGYSGSDADQLYYYFVTNDKEDYKAFVETLGKVKENNRNANTQLQLAPHYYEFSVAFDDFTGYDYTYKIYCTGDDGMINDPFDEFFALPSIQEKMEIERAKYRN